MKYSAIFLMILMINFDAQTQNTTVIPQPASMETSDGVFRLTRTTTVGFNNPDAEKAALLLAEKVNKPTGYQLKVSPGKLGDIQFNIIELDDRNKEAYLIDIRPKRVVISANTPVGLFYGLQTLIQMLPEQIESNVLVREQEWTIPTGSITDSPRFGWRGLMLDVSRHFYSVEEVKLFIDQMARYKYNVFHWHLTDDNGWRIDIESLPKLTSIGSRRVKRYGHFGDRSDPVEGEAATDGGFYTQDEIREIVQYAADQYITVVPEIDVPGHSMAALAAYPELSCTQTPKRYVNPGTKFAEWYGNGHFKMLVDNTLNPANEKVYEFLDKVFTEVAELFPSQYIHVGGDECYKGYWEKSPDCQALMKKLNTKDVEKLQGYFMERLEKILSSKGKKLLGWDEILEGGLSPGATVMSWRGIKGGIEAAKKGHNVVMTPTTYCYLDYNQGEPTIDPPIYANLRVSKSYEFNPVPEGVNSKYILGGQGNIWTEQIPTMRYLQYMLWPRGLALAEVFWSPQKLRNWQSFANRMVHHFKRFDQAGINYSKAVYDPIVSCREVDKELIVELTAEAPNVDIYYSIDDTMPDNHSLKYDGPIHIPPGPVTLRFLTYLNNKPKGHLIILSREELKKRME